MSAIDLKLISDEYLEDESGMTGPAKGIYFARSTEDIAAFMKDAYARGQAVTVQGSRTGLCGGAVPDGGVVLNLSQMNQIKRVTRMDSKEMHLLVQGGVTLCELERFFDKQLHIFGKRYCFPPNPTEDTATIGGVIACNSLGSHGNTVGSIRDYLISLTVVKVDGTVVRISGADEQAEPYIGSEGSLGVIAGAEIVLLVEPEVRYGVLCYFAADSQVLAFGEQLKGLDPAVKISSAEYLDSAALRLVERQREEISEFKKIPALAWEPYAAALLLELCSDSEADMMEGLEQLLGFLDEVGADVDHTIVAEDQTERERLSLVKHAVIKAANLENRKTFKSSGVLPDFYDVVLPAENYASVLDWVHRADGPERLVYGHILTGHLHLHLLTKAVSYGEAFIALAQAQQAAMGHDFGLGKRRRNPF